MLQIGAHCHVGDILWLMPGSTYDLGIAMLASQHMNPTMLVTYTDQGQSGSKLSNCHLHNFTMLVPCIDPGSPLTIAVTCSDQAQP